MWAILNTLSNTDVEEVVIDSSANWQAVQGVQHGSASGVSSLVGGPNSSPNNAAGPTGTGVNSVQNIKQEKLDDMSKVMSPGSTTLPTWDNSQAMSPYMSHDMNSIANGNMMGQR